MECGDDDLDKHYCASLSFIWKQFFNKIEGSDSDSDIEYPEDDGSLGDDDADINPSGDKSNWDQGHGQGHAPSQGPPGGEHGGNRNWGQGHGPSQGSSVNEHGAFYFDGDYQARHSQMHGGNEDSDSSSISDEQSSSSSGSEDPDDDSDVNFVWVSESNLHPEESTTNTNRAPYEKASLCLSSEDELQNVSSEGLQVNEQFGFVRSNASTDPEGGYFAADLASAVCRPRNV